MRSGERTAYIELSCRVDENDLLRWCQSLDLQEFSSDHFYGVSISYRVFKSSLAASKNQHLL